MGVRVPRARISLEAVSRLWQPPDEVEELFAEALELAPPEPSTLCHGDLHFRQLLVRRGTLTGIVDWVDLCRADPGVDLSLVYGLLPGSARAAFFEEYGEAAPDSLVRARVLALNLMAVLARYGRDEGIRRIEEEAVAGLGRVLA